MINVTKPFLPPMEEYQAYIAGIYQRGWLTNNGPLVNELELALRDFLQVPNALFLANGTLALQLSIHALELEGEIITTPFSFVATTSAIVWQHCTPVFADIDPVSFNIDPKAIEAAITDKTTAILATHVFGNPCDVIAIEQIAKQHNLKVIYDATHAFGTRYRDQAVFTYGDISITSFHATKLFHTVEGGAAFTANGQLAEKIARQRNFGYVHYDSFDGPGINAKNSELHAAMGLCNFKYLDQIFSRRKEQWLYYKELLKSMDMQFMTIMPDTVFNYSYFPLVFRDEQQLLHSMEALNLQYIYPRRYFYPALNKLNYVPEGACPVAEDIAPRILCLPLFHDLRKEEQQMIARILLRAAYK